MNAGELQPGKESQELPEAVQDEQPGKGVIHMHNNNIMPIFMFKAPLCLNTASQSHLHGCRLCWFTILFKTLVLSEKEFSKCLLFVFEQKL